MFFSNQLFPWIRRFAVAATAAVASWQAAAQTVFDAFDPNLDGNVYAIAVQPDGRLLIGGNFVKMQPNHFGSASIHFQIARLKADGSVDQSFQARCDGDVTTIALQADGKILIGGKFGNVWGGGDANPSPRNGIARLNANGTLDASFNPHPQFAPGQDNQAFPTAIVRAITVQADGKILIGGAFTAFAGITNPAPPQHLARLNIDGSLDSTFTAGVDNIVQAIAVQADGRILVGGGFRNYLATPQAAPQAAGFLLRLLTSGALDPAFTARADNRVLALKVAVDGRILVGGEFTHIVNGATTTTRTFLARLAIDGTVETAFNPAPNAAVEALAIQGDGKILVGGRFTSLDPGGTGVISRSYIIRVASSGALDTTFSVTPNAQVAAIGLQPDGGVILGGYFSSASSRGTAMQRNRLTRVQPDGFVETLFAPATGRVRQVIKESDTSYLVIGDFNSLAGVTRTDIARVDQNGAVVEGFHPSVDGVTAAVALDGNGDILIGGTFSFVNGLPRGGLARLHKADGSTDVDFDPRANSSVQAILVQADGKIVVGGAFTTFQNKGTGDLVGRVYLARLLTDGSVDTTFQCTPDGNVLTLLPQDGDSFLVGGDFGSLTPNGAKRFVSRRFLAKVSGIGLVDDNFDPSPNANVQVLAAQPDGKILVGGSFNSFLPKGAASSSTRRGIARLTPDGQLDATFDPSTDGPVYAIAVLPDNSIAIGGSFASLKPNGSTTAIARSSLAYLNADGTVQTGKDPQMNSVVWSLLPVDNDKLLVAGQFSAVFHADGNYVASDQQITRLTADGSVDSTFQPAASAAASGEVNAIALQPGGHVLVGGSFSELAGSTASYLTRLTYTGVPETDIDFRLNGPVNALYLRNPTEDVSNGTGPLAWLTEPGELRPPGEFSIAASSVLSGTVDAVLVQADGKVLLGGTFANTAGTTGGNLVRLNANGTFDLSFNPSPNGAVSAMAIDNAGHILVGGNFSLIGGADRKNFARLNADGSVDALDLRLDQPVREIALSGTDGAFYIGGQFTTVQFGSDTATSRPYLALVNADDTLNGGFAPSLDGGVFSILLQPDATRMLIGGTFGNANGTTHSGIARLNSTTGEVDAAFTLEFNDLVEDFAVQGGQILCGGDFTLARESASGDSLFPQHLARITIDSAGKATLDQAFQPDVTGIVRTVRVDSQNRVLIGGEFSGISDFSGSGFAIRRFVARFNADGTIDDGFNPQPDNSVWALVIRPDDSVVMGGAFAAILPEAPVLIGGSFTTVGNASLPRLARLNADGSADPRFSPNPDGTVYAIAGLADGRVMVGGDFENMGTTARAHLAIFDEGTLDAGFTTGTDGSVRAFSVQSDGRVIVGGSFGTIGGGAHQNLARVAVDGTVDAGFTPSTNGEVATVAVQPDGKIIVAGSFTTINGSAQPYLARLNADGTRDAAFAPAVNGPVAAVSLESGGAMLIGGQFTAIGGATRLRYARLTSAGSVDTGTRFDIDPGIVAVGSASEVHTISQLPDGRAFIGGVFRNAGGRARFLITRAPAAVAVTQSISVNATRTLITWTNGGSRPEFGVVNFAWGTDGTTFTDLGVAQRTGAPGVWQLTVPSLPANQLYYIRAQATLPTTRNYSTGRFETMWQFYNDRVAGPRTIGSLDAGASGIGGGGNTAGDVGGGTGDGGGTGVGSGSTGGTAGGGGAGGSGGSAGLTSGAYHLVNFSVRARPGDGDKLIAGFVLSAGGDRRVVLRAIGPGLENYQISGLMPAPLLELYDGNGQPVASAMAWNGSSSLEQAFADVSAFPLDPASADAAQAPMLSPGLYTTHVSPSDGVNGIALSEVYFDGDSGGLANLSARGPAGDGDAVLIVGFVVGGSEPRRFLIRGVGPGLLAYQIDNALVDPVTSVYDVDGHTVATNDDWEVQTSGTAADITAAESSSGAFALVSGSKDAALVLTLAPGVYTAHVTPSAGTSQGGTAPGTGLVEVYELPAAE